MPAVVVARGRRAVLALNQLQTGSGDASISCLTATKRWDENADNREAMPTETGPASKENLAQLLTARRRPPR